MSDFERPSARARRERLERIWPAPAPKAKRTRTKAHVPVPVEKIPDEADVYDPTVDEPPAGYMQESLEDPA